MAWQPPRHLANRRKTPDVSISQPFRPLSRRYSLQKVGALGRSLPANDEQIHTQAGDIILYQGNQITVYYGANSWNLTRLGKIDGIAAQELKDILGQRSSKCSSIYRNVQHGRSSFPPGFRRFRQIQFTYPILHRFVRCAARKTPALQPVPLNDDVLFGEVWAREGQLSLKMRSILTISALVSKGPCRLYRAESARRPAPRSGYASYSGSPAQMSRLP